MLQVQQMVNGKWVTIAECNTLPHAKAILGNRVAGFRVVKV